MLTIWREASPQPDMESAMDRLLVAFNEVKEDSRVVLGILAVALAAALRA